MTMCQTENNRVVLTTQEVDRLMILLQASYEAHGDTNILKCIEILMHDTNDEIKAYNGPFHIEWLNKAGLLQTVMG